MSMPVYNAIGSTGWNTAITANGTFCKILIVDLGTGRLTPAQYAANPMFDLIFWYLLGGSTGAGTVVTLNSVGADGTLRPLASPAAVTIVNSTAANGIINGPLHGAAFVVTNITGNGIAYAELIGSIRTL
jgi:hypothetical protein